MNLSHGMADLVSYGNAYRDIEQVLRICSDTYDYMACVYARWRWNYGRKKKEKKTSLFFSLNWFIMLTEYFNMSLMKLMIAIELIKCDTLFA